MSVIEEKDKNSLRQKYYLYGLIPLFIVSVLMVYAIDLITGLFFLLGFLWPYVYYTPGFREKASSPHYQYSLLGISYRFQNYLLTKLPLKKKPWALSMGRLIPPIVFTGPLLLLSPGWSYFAVLLGWAFFELFTYFNVRFHWGFLNQAA